MYSEWRDRIEYSHYFACFRLPNTFGLVRLSMNGTHVFMNRMA